MSCERCLSPLAVNKRSSHPYQRDQYEDVQQWVAHGRIVWRVASDSFAFGLLTAPLKIDPLSESPVLRALSRQWSAVLGDLHRAEGCEAASGSSQVASGWRRRRPFCRVASSAAPPATAMKPPSARQTAKPTPSLGQSRSAATNSIAARADARAIAHSTGCCFNCRYHATCER